VTAGRAVLVGAGHAHLHLIREAKQFTERGHELVVVAPGPFWYSGLATGMLGGLYPPELDRIDVAQLAARAGARFVEDRMVGLDRVGRNVLLQRSRPLPYDALSLNIGSEAPAIPGADGPRHYAVKPISRLLDLRRDLERAFTVSRAPRILVAGGGATGVELAANLAALAAGHAAAAEVTVLAAGDRFLRQLPPRAAALVRSKLERRGVRFRTGCRILRIEGDSAVMASGERLGFDFLLNATGLVPRPVLKALNLPLTGEGGLIIDERLRSPADPRIHAAGDCAALSGHMLPRIGVYAIRQAPVLLRNLLAALEGSEPCGFEPQSRYLWIMNLGDGTGLAARGSLWWHGRSAFWLKDRIDRRFLAAYRPV